MSRDIAYLRADASRKLGLGHVSRAVAMARALERAGMRAKVFMRDPDGERDGEAAKIQAHDDLIERIKSESVFLEALRRREARYLFIDLPATSEYAGLSRDLFPLFKGLTTICFDTFFDKELRFDLFVRPLFDGETSAENALVGLRYYVFPEELRALVPVKALRPSPRRVLVSLGGSDPHGATPVAAHALCEAFPSLRFSVVVGPGFAECTRGVLRQLAASQPNVELVIEPTDLGQLYLDCDLAVTSGGLTKFEAALFGLPALLVANTAQEEVLSKNFAAHGASVFIGAAKGLDVEKLKKELARVAEPRLAEKMSRCGRAILDIHGGERVIEHIQKSLS